MAVHGLRFFSRVYGAAQLRNVLGGILVRVGHSTACAGKHLALALAALSAAGTSLAGVGRIDDFQGNAGERRLVSQERAQLVERPGIVPAALFARALSGWFAP